MIVEYTKYHDDNWIFVWRENGERHEDIYWATGNVETPPIDEFRRDYPDLAEAEFVED